MRRRTFLLLAFLLVAAPAWAQPAFVASATANNSGTSITITKPAGTADGHILVACMEWESTAAITPPSGWTEKFQSTFTSQISRFFWKRASGEGASFQWTWTGSTNAYGVVAAYSNGFATGDPFSFSNSSQNTGTSWTATSGTTAVNNEMLIHCPMGGWTGALTPSAGFTLRGEEASGTARLTEKVQATAGATGSVTGSHAGAATDMAALLVGLKPAVAGPSTGSRGGNLLRGVAP